MVTPDGSLRLHDSSTYGLAASGSGDTLAGVIDGLAARGATLEQACAWSVVMHAQAGEQPASRLRPIGCLARELPVEMQWAMNPLQR